MRSSNNEIKVTFTYSEGGSNNKTFGTSSAWIKRTINRSDFISGMTLTSIKFERLGVGTSTTTAIDDIVLNEV